MQKTLLYFWLDLWLGATLGVLSLAAAAADAPTANTGAQSCATAKCQEALVNPVSGFAECAKPRGAPAQRGTHGQCTLDFGRGKIGAAQDHYRDACGPSRSYSRGSVLDRKCFIRPQARGSTPSL